jgi:hypothetical protein
MLDSPAMKPRPQSSPHRPCVPPARPAPRAAAASAIAALLVLAGCASVAPPRPSGPAQPPAVGARPVEIQDRRQRLVTLALQEWTLWGRPRIESAGRILGRPQTGPGTPRTEHEPDYSSRVLMYWSVLRGSEFPAERALLKDGSMVPWSAVFISFLMHAAGVPREVFLPSARHWDYIKRAHDFPDRAGFEALDAAREPPRVGDLICATRAWTAGVVTAFAQLAGDDSRGTYHCDLVVSIAPGLLGAIGGNVRDAVTWTDVNLDANGLLQPSPSRPWLAVLRNNVR